MATLGFRILNLRSLDDKDIKKLIKTTRLMLNTFTGLMRLSSLELQSTLNVFTLLQIGVHVTCT